MKVLVTLDIPSAGIDLMQQVGLQVEVWKQIEPMSPDILIEKSQACQAILCTGMDNINEAYLQSCPQLKILSQYGAGYDNIDIAAASKLGILVGNAPGAMNEATADIAFMLMLSASRKLTYLHKSIMAGAWGTFQPKAHLGQELQGKTLGIFGLGRIGLEMAKRCQGAYQMPVLYCNRHDNLKAEKLLQARKVSFDVLLAESDVLSVHCALTPETKGLFDLAAFRKMKSAALFINTSRGPVHNEQDLTTALQAGTIWGAGLDVTDPEPMVPDNPLLQMENVVVTPHIGSATVQAREQMSLLAAQNIIEFSQGKSLTNRVN